MECFGKQTSESELNSKKPVEMAEYFQLNLIIALNVLNNLHLWLQFSKTACDYAIRIRTENFTPLFYISSVFSIYNEFLDYSLLSCIILRP